MKAVRYLGFAFIPIKQNRSYLPWAGGAPNGAEIRPMQEEAVARKEDEEIEPLLLHRRRNATGPKQNLVFTKKSPRLRRWPLPTT